jgi:Mg2+ and Co2+ transporter CorA
MSQDVFVWLMIESNWWASVERLELKLQKLQWEATNIAGDQAFTKLTSFRRQLAEAHEILTEARNTVKRELSKNHVPWRVERRGLHAGESRSEKRGRPVAVEHHRKSEIDVRDLPELLEELLGRIHAMTHAVNEEIQMVIGAVQVEDARVMRRQTEWTVVLAVLAAIYLPMSLVTGIFGMNITEIDAGATAPDRWSVVNAWGVVFGATMGSVLVYAMARYVFRYRRVGVMLLGRGMRKVGKGRLYRSLRRLKDRLQESWLYLKIDGFREKMRELDLEAQKMGKME